MKPNKNIEKLGEINSFGDFMKKALSGALSVIKAILEAMIG